MLQQITDLVLMFLRQIAGGPGPRENNLVRFGLAAIFWIVLLAIAWSRQRGRERPRERLLMWGFGLGLARELFMLGHLSLGLLDLLPENSLHLTEPLEHGLGLASVVMVSAAFIRFSLRETAISRLFLQVGLAFTVVCYLAVAMWWPGFTTANPDTTFHQTWGAWAFHIPTAALILVAIILMQRAGDWLRGVVTLVLGLLLTSEIIMLSNFATNRAYSSVLCPLCNTFHIVAIPVLGYIYLREMTIERRRAEEQLEAYRDQLEELVEERTSELTVANQQLAQEVAERRQAQATLAELSRQNALVLHSAGEGIIGIDVHGKHTYVNQAAADMLGYSPEELLGRPSHITWHHTRADGSPYPAEACPIHAGFVEGETRKGDDELFWRRDGTSFPARFVSAPSHDNGNLTGAVVVFQDITERKQVEREIAVRSTQLAAQNAVASTLSQSLDLDHILNAALERVLELLEMDLGAVFLLEVDGETLTLRARRGGEAASALTRDTCRGWLRSNMCSKAMARHAPVVIDLPIEPPSEVPTYLQGEGLRTLLCTPLVAKGRALGSMLLGTREPGAVDTQVSGLLTAIGQQIGLAVENARLFQETERWVDALAMLHQASVVLTSTLDTQVIFQQVNEQAAKLLDCQASHIFRWDQEREQAEGVSSYGMDWNIEGQQIKPSESGIIASLVNDHQPIIIMDGKSDPRLPAAWREHSDIRAMLALPLWDMVKTLGVLILVDTQGPRQWEAQEVALAELFVNRAAVALENALLHEQAGRLAALEERQRIAADIHDGVGQILSYLGHQVDQVTALAESGEVDQVVAQQGHIREMLDQASVEVRRSIASLKEPARPRHPLQTHLLELVSDLPSGGRTQTTRLVSSETPLFLSSAALEQVLRIVQEALHNASRHAGAEQVTIQLDWKAGEARISVQDDGRGFNLEEQEADGGDHFGLSIMRARAARLDGRLQITSQAGEGTRVVLTWPVEAVAEAERPVGADQPAEGPPQGEDR